MLLGGIAEFRMERNHLLEAVVPTALSLTVIHLWRHTRSGAIRIVVAVAATAAAVVVHLVVVAVVRVVLGVHGVVNLGGVRRGNVVILDFTLSLLAVVNLLRGISVDLV